MNLFFIIFFTIYTLINSYVFIRGWQALTYLPFLKPFYIILFIIFAFSYIFVKIYAERLPAFMHDPLLWVGSFWFAFLLYFVLILFLIDITRFFDHFSSFLPANLRVPSDVTKFYSGIIVLSIVLLIVAAGFINRTNFKINSIELSLPKKASTLNELNVVMFSDLHLSPINDNDFLEKIILKVNSLNPDIVLLPGDIVDDKSGILRRNNIGTAFQKLNPKYGIIACTGNHEFINNADSAVKFMEDYGIKVLRDEFINIDDKFYVIGREDRSGNNFIGRKRKELQDILSGSTGELPSILLDHTPVGLNEAVKDKIDLQLSGHTHNGQMFPLNFLTKMIYEISWGYLKKDATQFYVSSGVGTWGPPVKLASDAEIVNLKIKFN
ncbi:MAG TPA: metallophosphoesterase [Ignavibacteriaceae bacterium]|nr:metallophosphoesterase [Ignavibacteriaceae bacterium]